MSDHIIIMVRKSEHMFEKVNMTSLESRVLLWLARNFDKEFYVREITKAVPGSLGGCHKVLRNLYDKGLITRRKSGRNVYYSINDRNQAIRYFKIFMNINELTGVIKLLQDKCSKIILFGSCAKGEDTIESDIDIVVITHEKDEVQRSLKFISLSREIAAVVLSPQDYIKVKERDKAFYSEVAKGITLWGDSNEGIREMSERKTAHQNSNI